MLNGSLSNPEKTLQVVVKCECGKKHLVTISNKIDIHTYISEKMLQYRKQLYEKFGAKECWCCGVFLFLDFPVEKFLKI